VSDTYTRTFGTVTYGVTVEALKDKVLEHPFDSARGGGYGRKTPADNPERLAREIGEDLTEAGWTRAGRSS
jgi:hypothetical protein